MRTVFTTMNKTEEQADFSISAASHKTLPSSFHLKVSNLSWRLHNGPNFDLLECFCFLYRFVFTKFFSDLEVEIRHQL